MNRKLARYFVKLIAEDLQFSFNGMGLPNNACEWLENQLMQENFDKVEEFIKKRYDEHENSAKDTNVRGKKRKHKLRTMTNDEFCTKWLLKHKFCKHLDEYCRPLVLSKACFKENANKPCKVNGKYILVEVKE